VSPSRDRSPWLGGPGARWAQALLFVLHVALLVALAICAWTFLRIRPRATFEPWQQALFFGGIAVTFAVFGARAVRIGLDLWRARDGQDRDSNQGSDESDLD
jgi:hypothetical protein